jgi:hypothetical protein
MFRLRRFGSAGRFGAFSPGFRDEARHSRRRKYYNRGMRRPPGDMSGPAHR